MKLAFAAAALALMLGGTSAFAADMPPAFHDWTGFYIGAQGGAAFTRPNEQVTSDLPASATEVSGGVNAQVLYQMDQFVFGAVADGNLSTPFASQTCVTDATRTCKTGSGSDFSLRGKLGFAQDNFMVYGTGGLGWADYQVNSYKTSDGSGALNDQRTLNGWVAGAGLSYAFSSNWISTMEYLHYDLGSGTSYSAAGLTVAPTMDTFTVGLGYKF